jgi:hypothetical protein
MYERTYHKAVLKTEEKPTKKSTRINWKMLAWIFAIVAVIVGLVFVIRMPKLQVRNINVVGANVVDPGDVTEFVNNQLQGNKLFFLPRTSIFLVPEHSLEREIKAQFPRLQTVSVSRKNFSTLTVSVTEFQGVYLWCTDATTCYFMDQNGVAFASAPYFSGSAYPKVFVGTLQALPFQAITQDQNNDIATLLDKLPALMITATEFHFVGDHELDVYFNHNGQQAMLMFDPTVDINESMNALFTGLRTDPLASEFHNPAKVLQYIDLRFTNRVVYKFQ